MVVKITRREFLLVSLSTGLVVLIPVSLHRGFTPDQQRTLLAVARTMFPHDHESDLIYMSAIGRVDSRCWSNAKLSSLISAGLLALERTCPETFTKANQSARVAALKAHEGSQFFQALYSELLEAIYGPPEMWSLFFRPAAA